MGEVQVLCCDVGHALAGHSAAGRIVPFELTFILMILIYLSTFSVDLELAI